MCITFTERAMWDEKAAEHGIDTVAKLPMDPQVAAKVDAGCAEDLTYPSCQPLHRKLKIFRSNKNEM